MQKIVFSFKYKEALKPGQDKKSERKTLTGSVEVPQFASVTDAIAYYESQESGKGESNLLEFINDSTKMRAIAAERATLSRGKDEFKILKKAVKEDPAIAAEFAALLARLGLAQA